MLTLFLDANNLTIWVTCNWVVHMQLHGPPSAV